MQKISEGYFYNIYDIGEDRVLKKKKKFSKIVQSVRGNSGRNSFTLLLKTFKYIKRCKNTTKRIKEKMTVVPLELLGNPVFEKNGMDYTQDRVVLLMDYFNIHTVEENKAIVDTYGTLVREFLKYGIHDHVYKFKNSYGINKNGTVVFIDFNEVTFSKEEVLNYVLKKHWKNEAQFRKFPEGDLKSHIAFTLESILTVESVSTLWSINENHPQLTA